MAGTVTNNAGGKGWKSVGSYIPCAPSYDGVGHVLGWLVGLFARADCQGLLVQRDATGPVDEHFVHHHPKKENDQLLPPLELSLSEAKTVTVAVNTSPASFNAF